MAMFSLESIGADERAGSCRLSSFLVGHLSDLRQHYPSQNDSPESIKSGLEDDR
jgi:hypothetical protein